MIRTYVDAEHRHRPEVVTTVRPEGRDRFTYNPELAWRAALIYERTGQYINPDEAANIDTAWLSDVNKMLRWLQYHRDYVKRPASMT